MTSSLCITRMTKYSLFTVFKPLLASVTFLFLRLKHLCLSSGVFLSSPSQSVVLQWSRAKPASILFGQGIADNVRDCNQASSCLHASRRLQELKELRLRKPWHRLWGMYIEIHVLPLTCWATLSKQSRTTAPWGTGHPYPIRVSGRQIFPTSEVSYCSCCMEAAQTPLKEGH